MKVPKQHTVARAGVIAVEAAVNDLGWLFREQAISDYGIDAEIEIVSDGKATGRLIAAQIKSGATYLSKEKDGGFVFRADAEHVDYWLNHSLPVIVVLHDPATGVCYWQTVRAETLGGKSGRTVIVPKEQRLGRETARRLALVAEGSPYQLRLRRLQIAKPYMEALERGTRLLLEVDEWINKSSGRGDFKLIAESAEGEETVLGEWPYVLLPGASYDEAIPQLFPWADLEVDEQTYEDADRDQWDLECGAWDSEDGDYIFHSQDFDEWRQGRGGGLRPYGDDGEVAHWRLELSLSEVGRAFLQLDRHLDGRG